MPTVLSKPASFFKSFLDIIMPPVCYVCGASCSGEYGLCEPCMARIKHIPPPACPKCGRKITGRIAECSDCAGRKSYIEKGWSCCFYDDIVKDCVHLFKYKGYIGLVDVFRDIMSDKARQNGIPGLADLIVPVPIHAAKKRERTYNHAEVLADALSNRLAIPMDARHLKKIKWSRSQSELDKTKRLLNVKDTFIAVEKNAFSARRVLLVDDVYTTGATINECAKVLHNAGAAKIFSLVLARG